MDVSLTVEPSLAGKSGNYSSDKPSSSISKVRPIDPETLYQAFLHRDGRNVKKTATISFQGNRYRVSPFLCGQSIQLRNERQRLIEAQLGGINFSQLTPRQRESGPGRL